MLGFARHRDLLIIDILSLTLLITILMFPDFPLRIVVGAFFVLFFPGYTLISSLFPRRKDLDPIERIALSIGLSLAVVPLIGLVLNYTPWGIRLIPVLLSLLIFTLSMSMLAFYRREKLPSVEAFKPPICFKYFSDRWHNLSRQDRLLTIGIIACLMVAGGLTAYFALMPRIGERFTEFYVLGPNGKIADYPTKLLLGESGTVILGIANHEYEAVNYNVKVKFDGETIATINGITLNHEEKWEQKYTFTPPKTGDKMKLEFLLYKNGEFEPYRKLHLWITVIPAFE